jgi:hypothetical protein
MPRLVVDTSTPIETSGIGIAVVERASSEAAATQLSWIKEPPPPPPPKKRGPKYRRNRERVKIEIERLGAAYPGKKPRKYWLKELRTSSSTLDRAKRELREKAAPK